MSHDILVIGASGFVGSYIYDYLSQISEFQVKGTAYSVSAPHLYSLDISDRASILALLYDLRPSTVIFCAGTKNLNRCEADPAYAMSLNVDSIRFYVDACAAIRLSPNTLYLSSDYVFDGLKGGYRYDSLVGPSTVYGITKLLAERLLLSSELPGQILRTSAVMGRKGGFFRWLENALKSGNKLDLFENTYFTPTSIGRLCEYLRDFVFSSDNRVNINVSHITDGCRMTRYEYRVRVADILGFPSSTLSASIAHYKTSIFQPDLSLLPDECANFGSVYDWDNMDKIF